MQANEPERYDFLERPTGHLAGTGLVVSRDEIDRALAEAFGAAEPLGTATRRFRGVAIADYHVYRIERPTAGPLPPLPSLSE